LIAWKAEKKIQYWFMLVSNITESGFFIKGYPKKTSAVRPGLHLSYTQRHKVE